MKFNENYKEMFDESFGKVTPDEFIEKMKALGYKFKSIEPDCKHEWVESPAGFRRCFYCSKYDD